MSLFISIPIVFFCFMSIVCLAVLCEHAKRLDEELRQLNKNLAEQKRVHNAVEKVNSQVK
jgi:AmiR/NasT family two-component response regulator